MKALVYHGPGQRAWERVPDPVILELTDAIVRIDSSTICGTDLHILKGDVPDAWPSMPASASALPAMPRASRVGDAMSVFPQAEAVATPRSVDGSPGDHGAMSYAIVWSENDQPEHAGRLDLTGSGVLLWGNGLGPAEARRELRYDELMEVYLERSSPAKLPWEPALVLVTREADRVAIGSLEGLGALHELAERVAFSRGNPPPDVPEHHRGAS